MPRSKKAAKNLTQQFAAKAKLGLDLAWDLYDQKCLSEAISVAESVYASAPDHASALCALGWFKLELGLFAAAEEALNKAIEVQEDFAPAHWYLGVLWQRSGALEDACHSLMRALELDRTLDSAAETLAWVLHDQGKLSDATLWSRWALSKRSNVQRQEQLAWLLLSQHQYGEAVELFRSVLNADPVRSLARAHLSTAMHALKRSAEAIAVLHQGLELSENDANLLLSLGWIQLHVGATEPAQFAADRLLRDHAELASAWHLRGVIWQHEGNSVQAEHCFHQAQLRDETLLDALVRRARLLREDKQPEAALQVLERALRQDLNDEDILTALTQTLIDLKQYDRARRLLHQLLGKAPKSGLLWEMLSHILSAKIRPEAAKRVLRRAAEVDPTFAGIWQRRIWIALEEGDLAAAHESLGRLLALVPEDPYVAIQAAFVFEASADATAAARYAEAALARLPEESEAWRCLAKVRLRQRRFSDAEHLLRKAQTLRDSPTAEFVNDFETP